MSVQVIFFIFCRHFLRFLFLMKYLHLYPQMLLRYLIDTSFQFQVDLFHFFWSFELELYKSKYFRKLQLRVNYNYFYSMNCQKYWQHNLWEKLLQVKILRTFEWTYRLRGLLEKPKFFDQTLYRVSSFLPFYRILCRSLNHFWQLDRSKRYRFSSFNFHNFH